MDKSASFLNGVPELLVLRLLGEREMYGYELVQAIASRTDNAISLGEGVIYPLLHALERDGALRARRQRVDGRERIYYGLTAAGRTRLSGIARNWSTLAAAIGRVLGEPGHA